MSLPQGSTAILVRHEHPVPGPPFDPVTALHPLGWHHFSTPHADAWVVYPTPGSTQWLLHWIESRRPSTGHGGALLDAIKAWSPDDHTGSLVCEPPLAPWYQRHGWTYTGEFGPMATMELWT